MALPWENASSSLRVLRLTLTANAEDGSLHFPVSVSTVSPANSLVALEAEGNADNRAQGVHISVRC